MSLPGQSRHSPNDRFEVEADVVVRPRDAMGHKETPTPSRNNKRHLVEFLDRVEVINPGLLRANE